MQMKVKPGGGVVEFPHARRHTAGHQFAVPAGIGQTSICTHPDTIAIWIYFTPAVIAPAAGTVAHVLRASGLRAEESDVLDTAITAFETIQHQPLRGIFHSVQDQPLCRAFIKSTAQLLE